MSTSLSAFDDEYEEDGRESQSSSDLDSRDGDLGTSNRPPSLSFNAYLTPDARSTTGSVAPRAKEKLARLCGGRKCIVTHELAPHAGIEVAHLLPRSTGATQLAKLELAFGLRYRQIHIDTTGNLEHIKSDLHRSFDHMGWFLLPELHVIQNILQFTVGPAGRTYKEVFPAAESFKYRLVPLQLIKDNIGIWRRKSSDPLVPLDTPDPSNPFPPPPAYDQIYPIGLPVFESLPILESRANPFFVVANAGPKLQAGMNLLPSSWISRVEIMTVNTIWTLWMSMEPSATWRAGSYSRRRGNGGRGGRKEGFQGPPGRHDGSPVPRRNPPRSGAGSGGGGPSGHGLARTTADVPELDCDHQSASTESDILTHDALRSVVSLDRTEFLRKWLQEDHWMNVPEVVVAA